MNDNCGCLVFTFAIVVLAFTFAALGFCGPDAAQNAREIIGR